MAIVQAKLEEKACGSPLGRTERPLLGGDVGMVVVVVQGGVAGSGRRWRL